MIKIDSRPVRFDPEAAVMAKSALLGMLSYHKMILSALASSQYLKSCSHQSEEIKKIGDQVDLVLCTCAWLIN